MGRQVEEDCAVASMMDDHTVLANLNLTQQLNNTWASSGGSTTSAAVAHQGDGESQSVLISC
jgi:hypothetical protein